MNKLFGMIISTVVVFGFSDIQVNAQSGGATATFEIKAEMHGGCEVMKSCPFYTLSPNGIITYTQPRILDSEFKQKPGIMNAQDFMELTQLLTAERLTSLEDSVFKGSCPSYNDGEDYIFEIMRDGQKTRLNTCENALGDDPQIDTLIGFFGVFYRELAK